MSEPSDFARAERAAIDFIELHGYQADFIGSEWWFASDDEAEFSITGLVKAITDALKTAQGEQK